MDQLKLLFQKIAKSRRIKELKETLNKEMKYGLIEKKVWDKFRINTEKSKEDLIKLLYKLKNKNKTVVGNSCPCRSSVLLNYCGIGKDLIPYIAEQPTFQSLVFIYRENICRL